MNKDYLKVIITLVVVAVVIIGGFLIYKEETKVSPLEDDIISFLEEYVLSEANQAELNDAVNALKENPEDPLALITIGRIRHGAGDIDGGIEFYLKGLEFQPGNVVALNNLADSYRHKKEYEKSAETYLRLIESTPKWINSYRALESIYKFRIPEKYPEMEQILLDGIEKTTGDDEYAIVDFYSILGDFYTQTNQIDKAIEYFEIVREIMPNDESVKAEIERLKKLK